MYNRERWTPVVIGVDTAVKITSQEIGGFLAKTTGTISVVDRRGTTIVDAVAVTAGLYTPMPFYLGGMGVDAIVTTAGGASGTLAA